MRTRRHCWRVHSAHRHRKAALQPCLSYSSSKPTDLSDVQGARTADNSKGVWGGGSVSTARVRLNRALEGPECLDDANRRAEAPRKIALDNHGRSQERPTRLIRRRTQGHGQPVQLAAAGVPEELGRDGPSLRATETGRTRIAVPKPPRAPPDRISSGAPSAPIRPQRCSIGGPRASTKSRFRDPRGPAPIGAEGGEPYRAQLGSALNIAMPRGST